MTGNKSPFTLDVNVCVCIFKKNRSNDKETDAKNGFDIHILCINVNITANTMLKFDGNADENIDVYANCERALKTRQCML